MRASHIHDFVQVERNQGTTYRAIYRRIVAPKDPAGA